MWLKRGRSSILMRSITCQAEEILQPIETPLRYSCHTITTAPPRDQDPLLSVIFCSLMVYEGSRLFQTGSGGVDSLQVKPCMVWYVKSLDWSRSSLFSCRLFKTCFIFTASHCFCCLDITSLHPCVLHLKFFMFSCSSLVFLDGFHWAKLLKYASLPATAVNMKTLWKGSKGPTIFSYLNTFSTFYCFYFLVFLPISSVCNSVDLESCDLPKLRHEITNLLDCLHPAVFTHAFTAFVFSAALNCSRLCPISVLLCLYNLTSVLILFNPLHFTSLAWLHCLNLFSFSLKSCWSSSFLNSLKLLHGTLCLHWF